MVREIKGVAAFDAEKVSINAALIAIVSAHNVHSSIGAQHTERGLASVAAVGARGSHVLHLPRTRLIAIRSRGQRADRTDVDAHATFFTLKMVFFIRRDN